jgi:hypothetical protein
VTTTLSPLGARLADLGITPEVFAAMTALPLERVTQLVEGDQPDGEEKIRLRVLDQSVPAKLAAERIRQRARNGNRHGPSDAERLGGVPPATEHGSGDKGRIDGRLPS